jgi:hypothetical protein
MRPKPIGFPFYLVRAIQEDRLRGVAVHQSVGLEGGSSARRGR